MDPTSQIVTTAVEMFAEGYSCSQALLGAFAPRFGLNREAALKLASPFGGGIARQGQLCGATSGAIMVLGLHGGRTDPDDQATRDTNDALVREFMERFQASKGSTMCNELTGVDISNTQKREVAQEGGVFERVCPEVVRLAASLVLELIERDGS